MSDEEFASKRERQKARRAARLEVEAKAAASAQRRRTATFGVIIAVVVALIGLLVFNQIRKGQREREQEQEVVARLDELGCTEDGEQTDLGGTHIEGTPEALIAEAPAIIYPDQPPSSGRHFAQVVATGVYDEVVDPRFTTHNMEHGYIVAWYDDDAPEDQVEEMKEWAQDQIDGDHPKIVVAKYYENFEGDANFAYTAWLFRQECRDFDADVAEVFTRTHYDTEGEGPEKGIPPHRPGNTGVRDPSEEGDLLLPPLDEELGESSALDSGDQGVIDHEGSETEHEATEHEATDGEATEAEDAPSPDEAVTE